jgi:hypothetical protein
VPPVIVELDDAASAVEALVPKPGRDAGASHAVTACAAEEQHDETGGESDARVSDTAVLTGKVAR